MQHEDFNILYSEIMYKERDIIQRFLEKQYDIRYGRQRDSWHFEPAVELVAHQGSHVLLHDIKLDKDKFVVFYVEAFCEKNAEWECSDFAYGELSKVIEALPNAEDIVWDNAVNDLKVMTTNLRIDYLLNESPFKYEVNGKFYTLDDVKCVNGTLSLVQALGNDTPASDLPTEVLVGLRDHINIEVLHRSNEYKELMELLSLEENMRFECQNYGDATFVIDGTDVTFDVSSVRRDDKGNLVIYGNDIDAEVCDNIELTEKDIKPQYLASIIECMKPKCSDIIDTYNGHNAELVRKINAAWKDAKYHDSFGDILYALACRDMAEWEEKYNDIIHDSEDAMNHAHEIMEGVCDDWDLETILSFIRYK
jgi:hypothetical protein